MTDISPPNSPAAVAAVLGTAFPAQPTVAAPPSLTPAGTVAVGSPSTLPAGTAQAVSSAFSPSNLVTDVKVELQSPGFKAWVAKHKIALITVGVVLALLVVVKVLA